METTQMQKDIHELKELVQKLYTIIAGHELDKDSGVVAQVKDHDGRLRSIENFKDRAVWTAVGMGIPAGFGIVEIFRAILLAIK